MCKIRIFLAGRRTHGLDETKITQDAKEITKTRIKEPFRSFLGASIRT